jgi:hypothetical protein
MCRWILRSRFVILTRRLFEPLLDNMLRLRLRNSLQGL